MRGRFRRTATALGVLLATAVLVLPASASAAAEGPPAAPRELLGDSAPTFDVVLTLGTDGVVRVRETISYDFTRPGEQGIVRRVAYRHGRRLYDVHGVRTSSSTGAPARAQTVRLLHDVRISVGEGERRAGGRQAYVIEYEVAGAFTPRAGHVELVWDAVGDSWPVPIGEAAVRVEAPVPLRRVGCRAGRPPATTKCLRDRDGPYAVGFTQSGLRPREGMTVKVRLPEGTIAVPPPRYSAPRWQGTWPGALVLLLALGAAASLARGPLPDRRVAAFLGAAGATLMIADAAAEIAAGDPWGLSLGDPFVAGLALAVAGAAAAVVRRTRTTEHATDIRR
ncbi:DUF2207 domain-containing protein [Actinomadura hibisca]|uniref:DUF2207 domain-containing protein n=1 Tax=Actinomadura hibisca TaxID=68565 RepID=UPI000830CEFA|nr:DUF2207 domain-containing protein [Actinomadura hibisca]